MKELMTIEDALSNIELDDKGKESPQIASSLVEAKEALSNARQDIADVREKAEGIIQEWAMDTTVRKEVVRQFAQFVLRKLS